MKAFLLVMVAISGFLLIGICGGPETKGFLAVAGMAITVLVMVGFVALVAMV